MNDDILYMVKIYSTYDTDWLGDKFNDLSELTRHHIVKKEHGGQDSIKNYALLTRKSHSFIHYLEVNYNKEYNYLNSKFIELNNSLTSPSINYYEDVCKVVKRVRKKIKNNRRKREGKNV